MKSTEDFGKVLCKIGNQTCYLIKSDILDKKDVRIWDGQRSLNDKRVKELVAYQEEKFKTHGYFLFRGALLLCHDLASGCIFLIDGQHRYATMKTLIDKEIYPVFDVRLDILEVKSTSDILKEFQDVNRSVPVPICVLEPNEVINVCLRLVEKKFTKAFTKSATRRPQINIEEFKSALITENVVKNFNLNEHMLYDAICKLNNDYMTTNETILIDRLARKDKNEAKTVKNCIVKCSTGDYLFIGLFKKTDQSWMRDLIGVLMEM